MSSGRVRVGPGAGREFVLRPVTPADYEELVAIYASTRADELAQVPWTDEQKYAFCRMQYDAQKADYDRRYPEAQYDLILLEGRPAGRLWIGRDDELLHMLDISLLPWAQGQGIGTTLVRQLIEEARSSGKQLRHMVFVMNEGARRLYERLGFVVFEEVGPYLHMEWRPGGDEGANREEA